MTWLVNVWTATLIFIGSVFGIGSAPPPAQQSPSQSAPIVASTTGLSDIKTYTNSAPPFSIQYPSGYSVDPNYIYQELGPHKSISGVKFTIPASIAKGTNLSSDSYLSIEWVPTDANPRCSPSYFLPGSPKDVVVNTSSGGLYEVASTTGAAAGNRSEETVYAYAGLDTPFCVVERYFIHYGVIENYPAGTVKEFDRTALITHFDSIVQTIRSNTQSQALSPSGVTPISSLDPRVLQVINSKRKVDIIPNCTQDPNICQIKISREEASKKIAALISSSTFDAGSVTLEGGSVLVTPSQCSRGGGGLNQNGFFWTYSQWGFDGIVQVNAATGEDGVCLWPVGDH